MILSVDLGEVGFSMRNGWPWSWTGVTPPAWCMSPHQKSPFRASETSTAQETGPRGVCHSLKPHLLGTHILLFLPVPHLLKGRRWDVTNKI